MQINLETEPHPVIETEALVSYVFEEGARQGESQSWIRPRRFRRKLAKGGELTGKALEMTLIHAPAGLKAGACCWLGPASGKKLQCQNSKNRRRRTALFEIARSKACCVFRSGKRLQRKMPRKRITEGC